MCALSDASRPLTCTSLNWIIKPTRVRRIDARDSANCGLVNNGNDLLHRSSPSAIEGKCRVRVGWPGVWRVECPLNKQIPKLAHYLRQYRVADSALWTLDGQRVGSVIYPAAVWTRDVVAVRAAGRREEGRKFRSSPPVGGKTRWITKISASTRVPRLPARLTRGFSAEKHSASLFSLSTRRRMLLNPWRLPAKKTGIFARVNCFVNHSRERERRRINYSKYKQTILKSYSGLIFNIAWLL